MGTFLGSIAGWMSIDVVAALFGLIAATIAFRSTPNGGDIGAVAVGFASGSSAFLLGVMAVLVFDPDPKHSLFDSLLTKNGVLLFGALGYAALINIRTCPGILSLFNRTKPAEKVGVE
jgi:hypothetical protein